MAFCIVAAVVPKCSFFSNLNLQLTVEYPAGGIFHEPSHSRGDTLSQYNTTASASGRPLFVSRVSANADCMAADCMALFTCDRSLIETSDNNDQEMRPNTFLHIVNLGVWNWEIMYENEQRILVLGDACCHLRDLGKRFPMINVFTFSWEASALKWWIIIALAL